MHIVSKAYKTAMDNYIRDRGYIQISLGVISSEAQGSASISASDNDLAYWSKSKTVFATDYDASTEYATFESNMFKADGKSLFLPTRLDFFHPFKNVGVVTDDLLGSIKIKFADAYAIKGLTIDFGSKYPTAFTIKNSAGTEFSCTNTSSTYTCTTVFGTTSSIEIIPTTMVNGTGRLRIKHILMGVGLSFGNNEVKTSSFKEYVSPISEEVSSQSFSVTILDPENKFNVDSSESYINFLEIGQDVNVAMGITLADKTIEWMNIAKLKLKSWGSKVREFNFQAEDLFAQKDDKYTAGNNVYSRTAYQEAISILTDMGLTSDQYSVDCYLASISLTNPIPECTHKEALQILANACRCVVYQDFSGIIRIYGNFAIVIEPEDITVNDYNSDAVWSHPRNTLVGSNYIYADFTKDFLKADGGMYFLPESGSNYLATAYSSNLVADSSGNFTTNPAISYELEAGYQYFGVLLDFDGNAPQTVVMTTYYNNSLVETVTFTDLESGENFIYHEFERFDTVKFTFTKGSPNDRVILNKFSLGDYNDYELTSKSMFNDFLYGVQDKIIKQISVKIYTYTQATGEDPEEVKDDVWYTEVLNSIGDCLEVTNPLIHTTAQAQSLATWLKAYYNNNITYSVKYRGDPRLNCTDIIHAESPVLNNLQVAIVDHTLTFNGAWSGNLSMRKALRIT